MVASHIWSSSIFRTCKRMLGACGTVITGVEPRGKTLLTHFANRHTIYSHIYSHNQLVSAMPERHLKSSPASPVSAPQHDIAGPTGYFNNLVCCVLHYGLLPSHVQADSFPPGSSPPATSLQDGAPTVFFECSPHSFSVTKYRMERKYRGKTDH